MSALQRFAPRMAGFILIAGGFCISTMQAYLFGRARGEMSASSSADFSRLLQSARHHAAIGLRARWVREGCGSLKLWPSLKSGSNR